MFKVAALSVLLSLSAFTICAQETELKIPAEVASFIEPDKKAIALKSADLNGDNTEDYLLVLEELKDAPGFEQGRRHLLIITRGRDRKLTLAARNDKNLVYCRNCGGVSIGDPFVDVEVARRTFTVDHYGGSAWRWTASYKFNYSRIDNTWQLVRVERSSFHTSEPDKVKKEVLMPPKDFGKINVADFDADSSLEKAGARKATKK